MTGPVPTDPDDTELFITRTFNAPRDLVFRFWTDPDQLAKWWGPAGFHNPRDDVEIDCRVGGRFRMRMVQSDTGNEFWVHAEVVEFVEPEILALRFAPIPELGIPSVTTRVQFHDHGDKTRITLREGPTATEQREYTAAGWSESLDKLDQLLSVDRKAN